MQSPDSQIIPFARIKPDPVIVENWRQSIEALKEKGRTTYKFLSPIDALKDTERKLALPILPLPPAWVDFTKRARLYAGEMMAVAGPTGGGKTSFAMEIACAAVGNGIPVLWLPKELDPPEVNFRFVANRTRQHVQRIRDTWTVEQLGHALMPIADRWHFVDDFRDTEKQLRAIVDGIAVCKQVYGKAPLVVTDYLAKFARGENRRGELADVIEELRAIGITTDAFMMVLSQTSRGNNTLLTGQIDLNNAAEAIGVAAETSELEHAASVCVALNVFKEDDSEALDAHVLVSKARGTGREGRVGFMFVKAGGQWREQDHLPPTPSEVQAEIGRQKKDKGRIMPVDEPKAVRKEINTAKASKNENDRLSKIAEVIRLAGFDGLDIAGINRGIKTTNPGRTIRMLTELCAKGIIEEREPGRWRTK